MIEILGYLKKIGIDACLVKYDHVPDRKEIPFYRNIHSNHFTGGIVFNIRMARMISHIESGV